jgi:hypothetical protein
VVTTCARRFIPDGWRFRKEVDMGMRIPSGSSATATSQSSVAQWQQRVQQAQVQALVPSTPAAPPPANTGQYLNLVA